MEYIVRFLFGSDVKRFPRNRMFVGGEAEVVFIKEQQLFQTYPRNS